MPTPTLQLLYNPGEYIPYPIAPEGVPTVTDTATMEDLSPEVRGLIDRTDKQISEREKQEYYRRTGRDQFGRLMGEQPLQTEDHLFAGALIGGSGIKQGLRFLKSHPLLRAGLDIYGAGDGIVNLFTGDGVQKTWRLAKEGDAWGAVKSGAGDVLNLLGTTDLIRIGSKFNRANRALHALDVIEPASYRDPVKVAKKWVEDIITDKPVDIDNLYWRENPTKHSDKLGEEYLIDDFVMFEEEKADAMTRKLANEIALNSREDAWRLYLGFPQKYDTYIPNGDGTYKYNIEKLKQTGFNFSQFGSNRDYLTSNAGGWKTNFVKDVDSTNGVTRSIHNVEDVWDIQPFQNSEVSNSILASLPKWKFLSKIKDVEIGPIVGGKPFKLKMNIPFTSFTDKPPVLGHAKFGEGRTIPTSAKSNPDYEDAVAIRDFAKKYGYKIPKGIEHYSGEILDNYYKKILKQHNTFGRGVFKENPERDLVIPFSESINHGMFMPRYQNGIYTLASTSDYGDISGIIQRNMDFSGPRSTWISKNSFTPRIEDDINNAISRTLEPFINGPHANMFKDRYGNIDYDKYHSAILERYPKLNDSRGRVFASNVGQNATYIIGGIDGEPVGTIRRMFKMRSTNPKTSTKGFSKVRAKRYDILDDNIDVLDDGTITGFDKNGGKL